MVRARVERIALLLFLLPALALAAPGLHMEIGKNEAELGRALEVRLFAVGLSDELDNIDLQPLSGDFGISRRDTAESIEDSRWPDEGVQRLRLKLYPRRSGTLTLPSLQLGQHRTQQQIIRVTAGQVKDQPITVSHSVSSQRPWQRQQIIIWTEITTPDRFATLQSDTSWALPGFEIISLPATSELSEDGGPSVLGIGWALFPQLSGEYRIDPPPIAYRLSGGTRRQYYLPQITLNVRPLPPYVPPTMPVGKVSLASHLQAEQPLREGTLAYWNLSLSGIGLTPRWLPPLRRQIRSNSQIQFLPAQVKRSTQPDRHGVHGRADYQFPLKSQDSGRLSLPTIRLQYFDPDSGRLITVRHRPERPWVYSPTLLMIVAGLLLIALLRFAPSFYRRARQRWQRRQKRRQAFKILAAAENPCALRAALKPLAEAEGWPGNLSLHAWGQAWKNHYRIDDTFDELLTALSDASYSKKNDANFAELKSSLLSAIQAPHQGFHGCWNPYAERRFGTRALQHGVPYDKSQEVNMFGNPSLITRIAIGKAIGFLFGLVGFIFLPYFLPEADWLLRWGILLWYTTVGAIIGVFGVFTYHPVLKLPFPWWFRAPLMGAWMNFVLTFFAYDVMQTMMVSMFGAGGVFSSPFWFTAEGAIVGLIIGYFATRYGGEGKETVNQ